MARWRMAAGNDALRRPRVGITGCVRDQGLAIVKGVLEQHEVAALRADLLALLDPKGEAPAAVTRTLYAFVEHSPAAAALLRNQRFMGIHRAICGADETSGLTLHRTVASLKTAGEGPLEWHRDRATHYPAGPPQTSGQVLNTGPEPNGMYFYLNGCSPARGGIAVIPGSQREAWAPPPGFEFANTGRSGIRRVSDAPLGRPHHGGGGEHRDKSDYHFRNSY
jgi:hypothetical protein